MNRRIARETAFELVFEYEYNRDLSPEQLFSVAVAERGIEVDDYVRSVYFGVTEKIAEIDEKITASAIGWRSDRLSKVSLAIMRICVYEMLYVEDVPFNVAINEAVELAKKYDHDTAPAFVNGVVNAVAEKEGVKGVDGKKVQEDE